MKLNPLTQKKIKRFRSIKRGYYSFLIIMAMIGLSFGAELLVSNRALIVCYQGHYYFPTYGYQRAGKTFGLE